MELSSNFRPESATQRLKVLRPGGAGGAQMIIANVVIAAVLAKEFGAHGVNLPSSVSAGVVVLFCFFIAGFAW